MIRRGPSFFFLVLFAAASPLLGQQRLPDGVRAFSERVLGVATIPLDAAVPHEKLQKLAGAGIEPLGDVAYEITGVDQVTSAVFSDPSGAQLVLYHVLPQDIDIFLRVATNTAGQPEIRIWSEGLSEILIDADGVQWIERPSEERFRFRAVTNALSVPDTLSCIARAVGIAFDRSSLENGLARAACSATNTITLILTVTNCLSIPSAGPALVFGTIGCVNGFAKLLACGIARCTVCEVLSISPGRTVTGSWGAPCHSQRTPSSYARFYSFTITRRTTIDILATSRNADPVLYLLQGGAITSPVLTSNDNGGGGSNARIMRTLDAGTYIIELVSKGTDRGGDYSLSVR